MKPSEFQMAIYDSIQSRKRNIVINAVAGSGKTTTVVSSLNYLPNDKTLMVAFNKSIQLELASRVGSRASVSTFHGLGLRMVKKRLGKTVINNGVSRKLLKEMLPKERYSEIGSSILELTGVCKKHGVVPKGMQGIGCMPDVPETWDYLIHKFEIPIEDNDRDETIDITRQLLIDGINHALEYRVIDFDDMLYIPALKSCSQSDKYSTIFIDEAQDVSPTRIALATIALEKGGRIIAVGDRQQAIYGFTGADSNSIDSIKSQFDSLELPLSVCYRCDSSIIKLARGIVPVITARTGADNGVITTTNCLKTEDVCRGDLVICRYNAPLLKFCYKLISANTPCAMVGRDIGEGLVKFIESLRPNGIPGLKYKLARWLEEETEKRVSEKRLNLLEESQDKYDCVYAFIDNPKNTTISELLRSIQNMFLDTPKDDMVILSSVHRAKGLEAERVHILSYNRMPSSLAKQPWQKEQEMNIKYVAITRAKHYLNLEYVK